MEMFRAGTSYDWNFGRLGVSESPSRSPRDLLRLQVSTVTSQSLGPMDWIQPDSARSFLECRVRLDQAESGWIWLNTA